MCKNCYGGILEEVYESSSIVVKILTHRYKKKIPEPVPFLSRYGAQIGGLQVFSCNQNNCGPSGAYVTFIYCGLNV